MKFMNQAKKYAAGASVALVAMVSTSAMAEVPAAVGTATAAIQTDALALADLVWPVVIAITGATILIKLFKRFSSKI